MDLKPDQVGQLVAARQECRSAVSEDYDEVLREVTARIASTGSVGKADIGALVLWKRLQANTRWAARLNATPDGTVRAATRAAVEAVHDSNRSTADAAGSGRSALRSLPGFGHGDALASAVLVAAAPERMAIYDRRAHAALAQLGVQLDNASGRYGRYMQVAEDVREMVSRTHGLSWTARDVDLALYWLGGRR